MELKTIIQFPLLLLFWWIHILSVERWTVWVEMSVPFLWLLSPRRHSNAKILFINISFISLNFHKRFCFCIALVPCSVEMKCYGLSTKWHTHRIAMRLGITSAITIIVTPANLFFCSHSRWHFSVQHLSSVWFFGISGNTNTECRCKCLLFLKHLPNEEGRERERSSQRSNVQKKFEFLDFCLNLMFAYKQIELNVE